MRRFLLMAPSLFLLPLCACGEKDDTAGGYTCGEGTHPEGRECVPDTDTPCHCDTGGGDCEDLDGDGWPRSGGDCDDADPAVNPGQTEICNGVDDDCDGYVDNGADGASWWYPDGDGDGYGDENGKSVQSCSAPGGHVADGTDCDDDDDAINPGVEEVWYDGVDQDCAGDDDYDQDGDGYLGTDFGGEDCDDTSDQVGPHMSEVCDDGLDNDCDGTNNGCGISGALSVSDATATLRGEHNGDYAGLAVSGAGDTNGDGYDDLLVGVPRSDTNGSNAGDACLLLGPVSGEISLSSADAVLSGGAGGDLAGTAMAGVGDLDLDGLADVAIGAYGDDTAASGAGAVYLLPGPVTSGVLSTAPGALLGATENDSFGYAVIAAGDADLNGVPDLLVGAYGYDGGGSNAGAAFLFTSPPSGPVSAADAKAILYGTADANNAGWALGGGVDVNGDGMADLLVGVPYADDAGTDAGLVAMFHGCPSGSIATSGADALLLGAAAGDNAGYAVAGAGDVNGDGFDDILVGALGNDDGGNNAGSAYIFWGPVAGTRGMGDAETIVQGDTAAGRFGIAVAGGGDIDSDGHTDILVGGDRCAAGAGVTYLVLGPGMGTMLASSADATITGQTYNDWAGAAVAFAGDTNADGRADLLVGAWGADSGDTDSGAAYLFEGHGM
ncbi:MAG: MopE-related protein [Pseudomonadota bacterium]